MKPRTLSASSIAVFESCPARWKAEYMERRGGVAGPAAQIGTVCHSVLEALVKQRFWEKPLPAAGAAAEVIFTGEYPKLFKDDKSYVDDGLNMLETWLARQEPEYWSSREVLSAETKDGFVIPSSAGNIKFNYILDRCDRLPSGEIEVVDYKTIRERLTPEDLHEKIQARCYALAAQIKYPDAPRIWVTFDLLRHEPVGTVFSKAENGETWRFLKALTERVLASDGTEETINADCRYCVRKDECLTLNSAESTRAASAEDLTLNGAIDRRANLYHRKRAIEAMIDDFDRIILEHCEESGITEHTTPSGVKLKIGARSTRFVDTERAASIIGPELVAKYGNLTMSTVDYLLKKESPLDDQQRSMLRQLVQRKPGNATVTTK